jgi:hypothetical protein
MNNHHQYGKIAYSLSQLSDLFAKKNCPKIIDLFNFQGNFFQFYPFLINASYTFLSLSHQGLIKNISVIISLSFFHYYTFLKVYETVMSRLIWDRGITIYPGADNLNAATIQATT